MLRMIIALQHITEGSFINNHYCVSSLAQFWDDEITCGQQV